MYLQISMSQGQRSRTEACQALIPSCEVWMWRMWSFCQALNPHIVILSAKKFKELFVSQYGRGVLPRGCTDCLQDVGNQLHDQSPGRCHPRFLSAAFIILPSAPAKLELITVSCTLSIQWSFCLCTDSIRMLLSFANQSLDSLPVPVTPFSLCHSHHPTDLSVSACVFMLLEWCCCDHL